MRAGPRSIGLLLLGMGCAALAATAQKPAPQQNVTVVVVNALAQPPQPVKAVRVSLSYLESAVLITDAQQVTNSEGQASLLVSADASQRGNLRIAITGAGDLVIYEPADGQLPALAATLTIRLLPKGSAALLGPAQIEAMLHRSLFEVSSLRKQISVLKQDVAAAQQQKPDLSVAIAEWALANGFSAAEADEQVHLWAQNIQRQSAEATTEQKALAEVALKRYAAAAQSFDRAADTTHDEIDATEAEAAALQRALTDKVRDKLRQLISDRQQAAGAYQLNLQYHQATQTLESAVATAQAEYKKHPDDRGFHELWLKATSDAANARRSEGEVAPADRSLPLLERSADDFQSLAHEYTTVGDRAEAAAAQQGLGAALMAEGERATGDKGMALLNQAVQADRSALDVQTKADGPQDWARTQNDLGIALTREGQRTNGEKAMVLLDQAIQAYRSALEVRTKTDLPQEWARTQMNLGVALCAEGDRASGNEAMALLDQAVQAYQRALEIYTKADLPQDWARAETGLGVALDDEGNSASGDKAASLLGQAVEAYRHALEVLTKDDLPQDWAMTQTDLGAALVDEGKRDTGPQSMALLNQAVEAYRSALEIFTEADLPQFWAATQDSLGIALQHQGERASGDKAVPLFDQAVQAYHNALEVYTKVDLPQFWAGTQVNLGNALMDQGERVDGDKAMALFDQAVEAFQHALEVNTKAHLPQDWAMTQTDLGIALLTEGELMEGDKAIERLDQSVQAFEHALEVYTKTDFAWDWAITQIDLMEANLAASHFSDCAQAGERLGDVALPPAMLNVRDSMLLACRWAGREKSAALETEKLLATESAKAGAGMWDASGLKHALSTEPVFASGRASWVALFTAVQDGDPAAMTAALHQLEPILEQ